MSLKKFLMVLLPAMLVLASAVIWFYPSREDFRQDNPFWNGLSVFTAEFGAEVLDTYDRLPPVSEGTVLVLIPYLPLDGAELERLAVYVERGGTVIIMDDFGHGNEVLEHLDMDFRFSGGILLDPVFNARNKLFPSIGRTSAMLEAGVVDRVYLNHATTLEGGSEDDVLAWSTRFSYLDMDGNLVIGEGDEQQGPFPVIASVEAGDGFVIMVSDPSLLINSMMDIGDNRVFVQNLVGYWGSDPVVYIDRAHLPEAALDQAKGGLQAVYGHLSSPFGVSVLALAGLALVLLPFWRRGHTHMEKGD